MIKIKFYTLAFAIISSYTLGFGQNVGIGTSNPQTKLQVVGAISSVPVSAAAATTVTIPNNTSVFRLTAVTGIQANTLSMATPTEGQYLTIYNEDADNATFAGATIPGNTSASFNYINSAWRLTAKSNFGNQTITFTPTGDVTGTATGTTTLTPALSIGAGKVTNTMLAGSIDLTTKVAGLLPIANGGTNSSAAPTAGSIAYGTGTAYAFTPVGTAGQILLSNGASAPTWTTPTTGTPGFGSWTKALTASTAAVKTDNQYVLGNIGLGGHDGGGSPADAAYNFATTAPAVPLVVVSPGNATAASSPVATALRLAQPGSNGSKWPLSADFRLGSYATSGINAQSQLNLVLGNGATATPDVTVLSVLGSGSIGIGTTTPSSRLQVTASGSSDQYVARFTQTNTTNGITTFIGLGTETNAASWSKAAIGFQRTGNYDMGDITFNLSSNNTSGINAAESDERMRITSAGNVGIGTSPSTKLHVSGFGLFGPAGTSELWLTQNWQSKADANAYSSEISNDISSYKALMLVGNKSAGGGRIVAMWDRLGIANSTPAYNLDVNGSGRFAGNLYINNEQYILPTANGNYVRIGNASGGQMQDVYSNYFYALGRIRIGNASSPNSVLHVEAAQYNSSVVNTENYVALFKNTSTNGGAIMTNVANNGNAARYVQFMVNGSEVGCLYGNGSNVASLYSASDERLKTNIRNTGLGLNTIMKMRIRDYEWKADGKTVNAGFIAQELYEVYPEAVSKGNDAAIDSTGGTWMVNYAGITPLLVKAIQDQQAEIEKLQKQNSNLKTENGELLKKMKAQIDVINERLSIKTEN